MKHVAPPGLERAPRASLIQLRSLEAVARLGGVGQAAQALHLAQPTVSSQLKELANALGLVLYLVWRQDRTLSLPARTLVDDLRARLGVRAPPV